MIKQIESEVDKPVLLLDAGALFFEQPTLPPALLPMRTIQAQGVGRAMQAMRYGAIGIAPHDLAAGTDFLVGQGREHALPLLSANLVDSAGKKVFKPSLLTKAGESTVAVVGLTGEPANQAGGPRVLPWRETLPDVLKKIKDHAEMTILLSSYPEPVNREIAAAHPDIHLIIQAGTSGAHREPYLVGNTLMAQVAARGKYLGRLDIDWQPSRRWRQDQGGQPLLQQARAGLDRIAWRMGRLEQRTPNRNDLANNQEYRQLLQERDRLNGEVARLEQATPNTDEELSTYSSALIPLKVSLPEDQPVQKIVQETKQEINRAGQRKQEEAGNRAGPDQGMPDRKDCRSCHPEQTAFWEKSGHAGAWQTLAAAQQQFNLDCLPCHVTRPANGQGEAATQQLLTALPPEMQAVGCEACHGPADGHGNSPGAERLAAPSINTCLTCHSSEHDSDFDYARMLPLIRCPAPPPNKKGAA